MHEYGTSHFPVSAFPYQSRLLHDWSDHYSPVMGHLGLFSCVLGIPLELTVEAGNAGENAALLCSAHCIVMGTFEGRSLQPALGLSLYRLNIEIFAIQLSNCLSNNVNCHIDRMPSHCVRGGRNKSSKGFVYGDCGILAQPPILPPWSLCSWPHCVSLRRLRRQPGWHPQDKSLLSTLGFESLFSGDWSPEDMGHKVCTLFALLICPSLYLLHRPFSPQSSNLFFLGPWPTSCYIYHYPGFLLYLHFRPSFSVYKINDKPYCSQPLPTRISHCLLGPPWEDLKSQEAGKRARGSKKGRKIKHDGVLPNWYQGIPIL